MFRSLRIQLGAIVFGFVLLAAGSVVATFLFVQTQFSYAATRDAAERERLLLQQITWLAQSQPASPELTAAIQQFDQTLHALRDGGTGIVSNGRAAPIALASPDMRAQLDDAFAAWTALASRIRTADPAGLSTESARVLARLDAIAAAVQTQAQSELIRLQIVQLFLFAAALLLLVWGYFFTRRQFVQPLNQLNAAAHRIAAGHLDQRVTVHGGDEFARLARDLDAMRAQVAAARDQLESRVEQRTRELASAFELSQEIVTQLDLEHLLGSVTEHARVLTRADATSLCLSNAEGSALILSASSGRSDAPVEQRQPLWLSPTSQVIGADHAVAIDAACANCGFLHRHAPGHCIAAPLRVGERTLGALCVVRGGDASFDADETRALTLLANSAAIAIANAQLVEAGQHQARQAATLAERERLAAEFHDHLAQTLTFVNLKIERVKELIEARQIDRAGAELDRAKAAAGEAYGQVRAALVGLRESPPTTYNLAEKLEACVAEFREASGLPADLVIADPSALALPSVTQTQAFLIVREALVNVRRHAQARRAQVRVERTDGFVMFTVEDDGRGLDPSALDGDNHLGLTIMQTRAERSGGRLTIDSTPGAGTRIVARFALATDRAHVNVGEQT